jgi:hypothetical protein
MGPHHKAAVPSPRGDASPWALRAAPRWAAVISVCPKLSPPLSAPKAPSSFAAFWAGPCIRGRGMLKEENRAHKFKHPGA